MRAIRGMTGGTPVAALFLCLLAWALTAATPAAAAGTVGIFGALEFPRKGLKPFPKWTGALERHFRQMARKRGKCRKTLFTRCYYEDWQKLIARNRAAPAEGQLEDVNRYMNVHRYIIDPINWGVRDYWASPMQFFRKNGDCEDYAIAKYLTLRALGWSADKLRIVVLQDMNLRIAHAILSVRYGGKILVLDNQIPRVVDSRLVRHYRPIYAVNENGWWRLRSTR